jgi:calcineurin-like phosphoesterase family protein
MTYLITADTHFGHNQLVNMGIRPKNFERLIFSGLKILTPDSVLINLGDVSFYGHSIWHEMLCAYPGKKWLVRGNHDSQSIAWLLSKGWDSVSDSTALNLFGHRILFSHEPRSGDYTINIHGHLHERARREAHTNNRQILISEEINDYRPVDLKKLVEKFNKEQQ